MLRAIEEKIEKTKTKASFDFENQKNLIILVVYFDNQTVALHVVYFDQRSGANLKNVFFSKFCCKFLAFF